MNLHQVQRADQARTRETTEASARQTFVNFFAVATGVGATALRGEEAINFGTYFVERPVFTQGAIALFDFVNISFFADAYVLSFQQNEQGLYTGAEMGFSLGIVPIPGEPALPPELYDRVGVEFNLVFAGSALRTGGTFRVV